MSDTEPMNSNGYSLRKTLEVLAVLCNLLFTILFLNESPLAFVFGIIGPALLLVLCWKERLLAEPALQLSYILSAVIGWFNVQAGWVSAEITQKAHLFILLGSTVAAMVWGYLLKQRTNAYFPFLDAWVATLGISATWLMMYQVHESWLYLMVVNAASIFMYSRRRLYIASCMFVLYLFMSFDGYYHMHWFEL